MNIQDMVQLTKITEMVRFQFDRSVSRTSRGFRYGVDAKWKQDRNPRSNKML